MPLGKQQPKPKIQQVQPINPPPTDDDVSAAGYWQHEFHEIGQSIAISGARFAFDRNQNFFRRFVWIILIICGSGFMGFQIYLTISLYLQYPTQVSVEKRIVSSVAFPAVTVCAENKFSLTRITALALKKAVSELFPPYYDGKQPKASANRVNLGNWTKTDWRALYPQITINPKSFFVKCFYAGQACDPSNFTETWTEMGLCFTFNAGNSLETVRPGADYGLELLMDANQFEYSAMEDYSAGFRVLLHNGTDYPNMLKGFKASAGAVSNAKISRTEYTHLHAPWGDCRNDLSLDYFTTYTYSNCIVECMSNFVQERCGCGYYGYPVAKGVRICDIKEDVTCVQVKVDLFVDSGISGSCGCHPACFDSEYTESVSTSTLADFFVSYLTRNVSHITASITGVKNDYTAIFVYYPELSQMVYHAQEAYSASQMFSDLGGALGLLLGSTFFTLIEFFDMIVWAACMKNKRLQEQSHQRL